MIALLLAVAVIAPPTEGAPLISLAGAKRVMAAAQADAARRKVPATLAIVDQYGELVLVQVAANAQGGAVDEAVVRARAFVKYGAETRHDRHNAVAARADAGGSPLMSGGKIVGAIGDVGGAADMVAKAGAEMLK